MTTMTRTLSAAEAHARWKPGLPNDRKRRRLNAKAAAVMIHAMVGAKPTMHDLVAASGLCVHTVRAYVKAMHLIGAAHISGWALDKRGAYMTPRWSLGALPDVARPAPIEANARARAYRKGKALKAAGLPVPSLSRMARAFGASAASASSAAGAVAKG
jgi:hypothetical protein